MNNNASPQSQDENKIKEIPREQDFTQNKKSQEIQIGAKRRGNTETGKNAATPCGRACPRFRTPDARAESSRCCCADASALSRVKSSACYSKRRARSGRDRKIRSGRGPGPRACADASSETRFLAVVSQFE